MPLKKISQGTRKSHWVSRSYWNVKDHYETLLLFWNMYSHVLWEAIPCPNYFIACEARMCVMKVQEIVQVFDVEKSLINLRFELTYISVLFI